MTTLKVRGLQVTFPTLLQITLSSVKLCLSLNDVHRFCALCGETLFQLFSVYLYLNIVCCLLINIFLFFDIFYTSVADILKFLETRRSFSLEIDSDVLSGNIDLN
jgi:hypothetical protein